MGGERGTWQKVTEAQFGTEWPASTSAQPARQADNKFALVFPALGEEAILSLGIARPVATRGRGGMRVFVAAVAAALAATMAWSSAEAVDVQIDGFPFVCKSPEGEFLKPKFGDVDGIYFTGLPAARKPCLETIDRMIYSCTANTTFISHDLNNQYPDCLPTFERQAEQCVRHFEQERHKCYAGDSSAPAATTAEPEEPEVEPADLTMWAAKRSNIRSGPGTDHAKVGLLEVGDEVQVRGEIGDWLRITAPDGGEAFVYAPLLADADPVMDLDPKCQGFGKAKSCWLEITGRPNCYVWVSYLPDAFENVSWSGQCSGGFARGKGVLEVRYSNGNDMKYSRRFICRKISWPDCIYKPRREALWRWLLRRR